MITRLFYFGLLFFIVSCSSDSDSTVENNPELITVLDFLQTIDENP